VVFAVVVVAGLSLLTVTAMDSLTGEPDETVGLGVVDATTTTEAGSSARRTTTTTTRPATTTTTTTEVPEVLGEVTARDPEVPVPTPVSEPAPPTGGPATAAPAPPTTAAPSPPPPTPTPAPTTTTTVVCRNSDSPSCGPHRWDPEPEREAVEVREVSVPTRVRTGQLVTFAVDWVERAGEGATGACASWAIRAPGIDNVSTCEEVAHSCDRYGPHDPPPPASRAVRLARSVTFPDPGTYTVTVGGNTATHLADGCGSPYVNSWSRSYTVVVEQGS
jgi:hypothetical protein